MKQIALYIMLISLFGVGISTQLSIQTLKRQQRSMSESLTRLWSLKDGTEFWKTDTNRIKVMIGTNVIWDGTITAQSSSESGKTASGQKE